MGKLESILEYQKIDSKIYKEEKELAGSELVKRYTFLSNQLRAVQQTLLKMDKEAEGLFADVVRLEGQVERLHLQHKAAIHAAETARTPAQLKVAEHELQACSEQLQTLDKDVRRVFKRLEDINEEAARQNGVGIKFNRERRELKKEYDAKQAEIRAKFSKEYAALEGIRKDVDDAHFAAYKRLRDGKRMPAFCAYDAKSGNCNACGLSIHAVMEKKLKNPGDLAECPECHRIMFLKD